MHAHEAALKRGSSRLAAELAELFDALHDEAVPRVRARLDGGLVFRQDGSAADLRSLVFDVLPEDDRRRMLRRIRGACRAPPPERRGFVLLSDVDDTLLPGHDLLQIAGSDRSWHLDGRLYPGASRMHVELRAGLRDAHGGDYSVLLTARPPFFVRSLGSKLRRIAGVARPAMAILPGQAGAVNVALSTVRVLTGNYASLGETKVLRLVEYASLFPELAGRLVFVGDDGQADLEAAQEMLGLTTWHLEGSDSRAGGPLLDRRIATPLLAFVAVHATVQQGDAFTVPLERQAALVADVRRRHPPLHTTVFSDTSVGAALGPRHRFFYFLDYCDLAEQLAAAGWIEAAQRDAVVRGAQRDSLPDPRECAAACDLRGLRVGLSAWAGSVAEGDEVEQESFRLAGAALPGVVHAHLRLAPPPADARGVELRLLGGHLGGVRWPVGTEPPRLWLHDLGPAVQRGPRASFADDNGSLWLPWPCDSLCRGGARACIDARSAAGTGRCFVMLDDAAGAARDGGVVEVALVPQSDTPDVSDQVGEMTLQIRWTPNDFTSKAA